MDAVKFAAAYGTWLKAYSNKENLKVVIGRDARLSGEMIQNLVVSTLVGLGIDVIDLALSTTPTVEIAVPLEKADGGIILTASHNPKQWNALKLLNEKGEFWMLSKAQRFWPWPKKRILSLQRSMIWVRSLKMIHISISI